MTNRDTIHLLKEFPDKWILFILCLLVGIMHYYFQNDFTSQLLNSVVSALIGLLIGTSRTSVNNSIKTDSVNTPTITNPEMNNANINDPTINDATITVSPNSADSLEK